MLVSRNGRRKIISTTCNLVRFITTNNSHDCSSRILKIDTKENSVSVKTANVIETTVCSCKIQSWREKLHDYGHIDKYVKLLKFRKLLC